ncbi:MAG: DEAD/DEAH box helicase [Planctomycetota bacterium]
MLAAKATVNQLYEFQKSGIVQLLQSNSLLLADDMGLGKTVQALVALESLFSMRAVRRALVVCPTSLLLNWQREAQKWTPKHAAVIYRGSDRYGLLESGVPILITSFETIVQDWRLPSLNGTCFFATEFDVIIVDEAQRMKNPDSLRSRVLSHAIVPRRWALSGTPLENRPEELGSVLRFLVPNEFADANVFSDYAHILHTRDTLMLRRSKRDVLPELPEKIISDTYVEMNPDQKSEYHIELATVWKKLRALRDAPASKRRGVLLSGIQRLRRICILSSDNTDSGKLDYLEEEASKLASANEKAVIFSTFANQVLPVAAQRLKDFGVVLYRGEMNLKERDEASRRFREDKGTMIMLASTMAAGVGLTWTEARYVFQLDLWWNPQVLAQAEDRVHRIGQTRGVMIKRLISPESIEEGIARMLDRKRAIFEMVIEDNAVPGIDAVLSNKQLCEILGTGSRSS